MKSSEAQRTKRRTQGHRMESPELKPRSFDSKHMPFPLRFAIRWSAL